MIPPTDFAAIRRDFGFEEAADRAAAERLASMLRRPQYDTEDAVRRADPTGKTIVVVGAADDAAAALDRAPPDALLWCADGATTAARDAGRPVAAIVTDLDGTVHHELAAARRGAVVFVHAHGDNVPSLDRWVPQFPSSQVVGTCQVDPPPAPLRHPGGFTDGDRAVHLALELGAKEVVLLGFDFEKPGKYTGRHDPATKPRKLAWAKRLIDALVASGAPVRLG